MRNFYEHMFMKDLANTLISHNVNVDKLCESIILAVDEQGTDSLNEIWAGLKAVGSGLYGKAKQAMGDVAQQYSTAETEQAYLNSLSQLEKSTDWQGTQP
jgi:hypothetical protein